jgi:hypothetical protein
MAIGTDFEIQADKDIRYIGAAHGVSGAGYYTVLELHEWARGLGDDAAATGDDNYDITVVDLSNKAFDTIVELVNGFNIDQTTAEHLYGGSIIQAGGDDIWDGIQVVATAGTDMQIIQDNVVLANDFWNEIPFGESLKGLNADAANGISHQFMLKVRTSGTDIDGRRFVATTREFEYTYGERKINGTGRGVNVVALAGYVDDRNNNTAEATVATWTTITNTTEGYAGIDVNNDSTDEYYYSEWNRATYTINQFYERMKWLTRRGSTSTIYGLNGELFRGITHEITVDGPSGTFNAYEAVSWTGGTGQMLAINSTTSPTKMWIQLLTGVAPTDGQEITGGSSSATCDVNVTVTERAISAPFCGQSTGTALIGAYGFGVEATDLTASDTVFDLDNDPYSAPNYVQFSVGDNLDTSGTPDYVLVTNNESGGIDYDQFTLNGALTGGAVTSVVVNGAIPSDTPATGTIRIERDSGKYTRHPYSAWSGSTFTITSHNFSTDNASNSNNCFISYIDKQAASTTEQVTMIYSSPRTMFIRVRNGGATPIKTFETTAALGSAGGSATPVRTSDA